MWQMREIEEKLAIAIPRIAVRIQNELILACPVDTGRLRNSIKVRAEGNTLIIWMVDYGKFVEFGTPPHLIRPSSKQALKFEAGKVERLKKRGKEKDIVFAKAVKHPGTRPNPFIRNTIQTKIRKIIIEELEKA
jgi:hypothetical protein